MWAERLEARDTPSGAGEEVLSLPHLPGMGGVYPTEMQPPAPTVKKPLLQEPRGRYAVGTAGGGVAQVNVYDAKTGAMLGILNPFGRNYTGGVTVATGDVTGDGVEDVVVGAGRGRAPEVKVFDGVTLREVGSFLAYSKTFHGGVTVAVGDVTGDGRADLVTGAGVGSAPHVKVFGGAETFSKAGRMLTAAPVARMNFFAWDAGFRGGVSVAVGDVNHDGRGDVVVGQGPGGNGVRAFSGATGGTLLDLKPFGTAFDGGVSVAAGDVTGDGKAEVIAGAMRGVGQVKVFTGAVPVAAYTAFDARVGARVAVQDTDGDGVKEVLAAVGGGAPKVKVLAGTTGAVKRQFPAVLARFNSGLTVG
jgi:hypothetical protein